MAKDANITTTTTIPSHPPPTPPSPSASQPTAPKAPLPPKTQRSKLRILLLRLVYTLATSADRTLTRLSALLSTPSGTDALLCTLTYTLTLLRSLSAKVLERRLYTVAAKLAEKADTLLLPGEQLVATIPTSPSTKALANFVRSSKRVEDVVGDYRIFVRLWGLVGLYTWARLLHTAPLAQSASRKDSALRAVAWAEIAALIAFQVLENGAYLASKGVLDWGSEEGKRREVRWWVWSSRFWALYVGLEGVRLYTLHRYRRYLAHNDDGDGEKEDKIQREKRDREADREKQAWWRDAVSNVAYFPMTLHWSTETGLLSELGVGVLGSVAGGALLWDTWRGTA